jgi:hypothetical protein
MLGPVIMLTNLSTLSVITAAITETRYVTLQTNVLRLLIISKLLTNIPTILRVMKSRIIRWAGHVTRMERVEVCIGFCWGNLIEIDNWGDPGIDERVILRRIFGKWSVGYGRD